ncbi:MAG TPA: DUF1800 domain-containing protein [Saprospiraceae bacterium]|nr:DUF1800 domain-containing protein [Saprospiraceae bacterium]HQW24803.1 DUF1800 domain-containing protein [Saprospiraceae bacterium]
MKRKLLFSMLTLGFLSGTLKAQVILGSDPTQEIKVTTSSNYTPQYWTLSATGEKTINKVGLEGPLMEASRFLSQATLGADLATIEQVANQGIEAWIDDQMTVPQSQTLDRLNEVFAEVIEWYLVNGGNPDEVSTRPYWTIFNYTWWENHMKNDDLLRQKVALALSEIFVISIESNLSDAGFGLADYYDILLKHSFGNFEDMLREISLHPCMGYYLSHLNNPREIPEENIHSDENYAREIMQLFTIGLYELNQDGSRKTDGQGNWIPTYDQADIKELAKVFTGLGVGGVMENEWVDEPYFGLDIYVADMTTPMIMYEEWHQPGTKTLVNGYVIPAGQTGLKDINDAVHQLFLHPNVGPFIGKQLIQRLVTSNPTPGYISRVAAVFADNGQGERGDMGAVIKAILMDPEARTCSALEEDRFGKLREPFTRYTHFSKAIQMEQYYGRYWNVAYGFYQATNQMPLASRTVFNFFLPDFQPIGAIADNGLVGPEFQIHNSRTSIEFINRVNDWAVWGYVMDDWEAENPSVTYNIDELTPLARDPEVLINRLDVLFTHGMLSDRTRQIIKDAITPMISEDYRNDRTRLAMYLIMISPDYAIMK